MTETSHTDGESSKTVRAGRFSLVVDGDISVALADLAGVGPKTVARLQAREILDQLDLLSVFPNRYRRVLHHPDGAEFVTAQPEHATFRAAVVSVRKPRPRTKQPLEVIVSCDGERVVLVWFHIPGARFADSFHVGSWLEVEGAVDWSRTLPRMMHPRSRRAAGPSDEETRVRWEPVYPAMEGIGGRLLQKAIRQSFQETRSSLVDVVPSDVREMLDLGTIEDALSALHAIEAHDGDWEARLARARDRVVYEEFFTLQFAMASEQLKLRAAAAAPTYGDRTIARLLVRDLPFILTGDQGHVLGLLADELGSRVPMRRLLQGDVGSGKTIVALLLAAIVAGSGGQVALMAPTEVLASQHLANAQRLFAGHGIEVEYLGGSLGAADRRKALARIKSGAASVVVGTHALFSADVEFSALGLVVADEQHKFGVEQRNALLAKGREPHLLAMTATPIPRSLAHAVFGDLELAVLSERPPGREPVRTYLREPSARAKIYQWVDDAVIGAGHQAYVVFPAIDADARGFRALLAGAEELADEWLAGRRLGVLHGQMSPHDKLAVMRRFAQGEVDVLCATTVIEVGVDVANATAMVIESAEAFGLSQLHQLRGRVGRGDATSRCVLVQGATASDAARSRLRAFERTNDGFALAEMDLQMRGPGEFLGVRQAGAAEFRFGDLVRDADLLAQARRDVRRRLLGDVASED